MSTSTNLTDSVIRSDSFQAVRARIMNALKTLQTSVELEVRMTAALEAYLAGRVADTHAMLDSMGFDANGVLLSA